jgi:uracil-DNA glycosylase
VTADDLPAAFESLPAAWRKALPGWTAALQADVIERVRAASGTRPIAPADPLRALRFAAPEGIKVVILGQDPYPKPGHADGLAFSAGHGRPHSLQRVFKVLETDRPGFVPPANWALDDWARQGVLLLNPTLTVEVGVVGSHMNCGWHALTSQIVKALCGLKNPPTFLLWGKPANGFFDDSRPTGTAARILRTRHPSHDFKRQFMADGSHFVATQDCVDWWAIGREAGANVL